MVAFSWYRARLPAQSLALGVSLALAACDAGKSADAAEAGDAGSVPSAPDTSSGSADGGGTASGDASEPDASNTFDAATPADASADAGDLTGPLSFSTSEVTLTDADVIVEKVSYLSEGLRIVGQVCRPNPAGPRGPGPYPVAISNHGGFSGLDPKEWNGGNCVSQAKNGWVIAESSYRGEDGSEGRVEVCLGEVTDVLRLTAVVLAQPYADPTHVYMSGVSHGGCITTRAVQRGAPVQLAIDIFGPTDWAAAYRAWQAGIAANAVDKPSFQLLVAALDQAVGGGPDSHAAEYARRSPLSFGAELDGAALPYLHIQGGSDTLVPPPQGCALAAGRKGFRSYHVDIFGNVSTTAPTGCASSGLTWSSGPRPSTSWPEERYLMFYDDLGHNLDGLGASYMFPDMIAFLTARIPK